MLLHRQSAAGQSLTIVVSKGLGTAAATALVYLDTSSRLVLAAGLTILVIDICYTALLLRFPRRELTSGE